MTDLPRRVGKTVVAEANATDQVGILSLPALGAVNLDRRACETIVRLIEVLYWRNDAGPRDQSCHQQREATCSARLTIDIPFHGDVHALANATRAHHTNPPADRKRHRSMSLGEHALPDGRAEPSNHLHGALRFRWLQRCPLSTC